MAVANYFLELDSEPAAIKTRGRLADLVFLAHGWNFGFYEQPLIKEQIRARHPKCIWETFGKTKFAGPVIDKITKNNYLKPLDNHFFTNLFFVKYVSEFSAAEKEVMEAVYNHYARLNDTMFDDMKQNFSLWELYRNMTKIVSMEMKNHHFQVYYSAIVKRICHDNGDAAQSVDSVIGIFVEACKRDPTSTLSDLCVQAATWGSDFAAAQKGAENTRADQNNSPPLATPVF